MILNIYDFIPEDDITAKELAHVISLFGIKADSEGFNKMPEDVQRHFVQVPTPSPLIVPESVVASS